MFEDLISDNRNTKKVITDYGQCPSCGSTQFDDTDGQFVPNGYVSKTVCKRCGVKWVTTYDVDLNIVNIQHGGQDGDS